MKPWLVLSILLLAGCVGSSPQERIAQAQADLQLTAEARVEAERQRLDKKLAQEISAAQTAGASEAEILLLRARIEATQSAFEIAWAQASATAQERNYQREQAALDRVSTLESGSMMLQATQTHAAATVTAAYVDREASIGMAVGWAKVIVVLCLGVALSLLFFMLAKEIPPALRRRIDRSGIPVQEFRNGVAHQLPNGGFKIELLPSGGNGYREPPPINNWNHIVPAAPKAPGTVLQGDIITPEEMRRDRLIELAHDLIAASMAVNGKDSRDILGWREMGWSSEKWQAVKDALKKAELAWTDPGQGTHTGARMDDDLTLDDVLYTLDTDRNCLHSPPPSAYDGR